MLAFSDYFDNYAYPHPVWQEKVEEARAEASEPLPGLPQYILDETALDDGSPRYYRITRDVCDWLIDMLEEECEWCGVEVPALYAILDDEAVFGEAFIGLYAITLHARLIPHLTEDELRYEIAHEVKHLYQGEFQTREERLQLEYDSDRAGVRAAGYEAAKTFTQKAYAFAVSTKTGLPFNLVHSVLPAFLTSHNPLAVDYGRLCSDPDHPSPLSRMRAMQRYEKTLQENACNRA